MPIFSMLSFGRMPSNWGMGLVHNEGKCLDCDYGTTFDRVSFVANPELWVDGRLVGRPDVYLLGTGVGGELDSKERHGGAALLDATLQRHGRFADAGLWLEHVTPARFRRDPDAYVDLLLARAAAHREPAGLRVVHVGPVLR